MNELKAGDKVISEDRVGIIKTIGSKEATVVFLRGYIR